MNRCLATVAAAVVALSTVLGACSLPADEQATPIERDELGDVAEPSTTTTTLPEPTTTTTVPDPDASSSAATTTTLAPPRTETVSLFYTSGATDNIKRLDLEYLWPVDLRTVIGALESPRPEVAVSELRTAVRPGLITSFVLDRFTLNVTLDQSVLNTMSEEQIRRAIGQIVLTLTVFTPPDTGSIGLVAFFVDGSPISVFLPSAGTSSEVGAAVGYDDFRALLGDTPVVTTSTTPPVTTTSEPPAVTGPPSTPAP